MKKKKGIEQYYSGDENWKEWVEMCKEDFWENTEYQKLLLDKLNGNIDLAIVIFGRLGNESYNWIEKRVPALENLTPLECLTSKDLILRLRECLMRMH